MTMTTSPFPSLEDVLPEIRTLIEGAQHIGCLAHKDADADSLGSSLAFALSLREWGKKVHPLVPDPMPRLIEYLPGFATVETDAPPLDVLFTFDCATLGRFGERRSLVEQTPRVVNVDHHISNEGFGDVHLIDPTASATGQVVYRLLRALGAPIPADAATNLYAALFTDTGGFRHENTTEETLRLGADLVALGANPGWVALHSYKWRSVSQVKLEGMAISRIRSEHDGQLVWSEITQDMLREAGADMQEAEGVIDQLQSIAPMKIALLFKEHTEAVTKLSVRTRDEYDATTLCTPFGGGGHYRAAGAEIRERLSVAQERALNIARAQLSTRP